MDIMFKVQKIMIDRCCGRVFPGGGCNYLEKFVIK
jgi:hypothetical protein